MNEPQLFNFNGQPTLDSREVAKMIGKSHKNLMRDIRQYIKDLGPGSKIEPGPILHRKQLQRCKRSVPSMLPADQAGLRIRGQQVNW